MYWATLWLESDGEVDIGAMKVLRLGIGDSRRGRSRRGFRRIGCRPLLAGPSPYYETLAAADAQQPCTPSSKRGSGSLVGDCRFSSSRVRAGKR
jgi:hypothetical protein